MNLTSITSLGPPETAVPKKSEEDAKDVFSELMKVISVDVPLAVTPRTPTATSDGSGSATAKADGNVLIAPDAPDAVDSQPPVLESEMRQPETPAYLHPVEPEIWQRIGERKPPLVDGAGKETADILKHRGPQTPNLLRDNAAAKKGDEIVLERSPISPNKDLGLSAPARHTTFDAVTREFYAGEKPAEGSTAFGSNLDLQSVERPTVTQPALPVETRTIIEAVGLRTIEAVTALVGNSEKKVLRMRLTPAELGGLEVSVERSSTGTVSAHLRSDTVDAHRILTTHLPDLRTMLANAGITIQQLGTSFGAASHDGSGRDAEGRPPVFANDARATHSTQTASESRDSEVLSLFA